VGICSLGVGYGERIYLQLRLALPLEFDYSCCEQSEVVDVACYSKLVMYVSDVGYWNSGNAVGIQKLGSEDWEIRRRWRIEDCLNGILEPGAPCSFVRSEGIGL